MSRTAPSDEAEMLRHLSRNTDDVVAGVFREMGLGCPACHGSRVVPASGPGMKGRLVMPCPACTREENA